MLLIPVPTKDQKEVGDVNKELQNHLWGETYAMWVDLYMDNSHRKFSSSIETLGEGESYEL